MTKRKTRKPSNNKISNLTNTILSILKKDRNQNFNYKQIAAKIGVNDASSRNQIIKKLQQLKAKEEIEEVERGKFAIVNNNEYHTGRVDMASRGSGYIISDDFEDDTYISSNNMNKALHGDEVEFYVYKRKNRGKQEGEVTNIIKRAKSEYVGVIQLHKNYAFVVVDGNKMYTDIFVPISKINNAENGDKVLVALEEWPEKADSPNGKILEVLGKPGEHNTEMHAILAEYGLPLDFPPEIEAFADKIDTSITEEEIAKRRDMRKDLTFTIDPKDAKDFDDALSFTVLEDGLYEIGIHIADVSHYLTPDNVLDDEAYERATSVYLVDRVVPMLPEILSNNACSLRPNEEKYTFSAVFKINDKAEIMDQWFGKTVTYSDARFAYEEAQAIIENNLGLKASEVIKNPGKIDTTIPQEVAISGKEYKTTQEVAQATLKLDELAKIMRSKRMSAGAISFDKVEVKFNLDEEANPIGVFFKTSKDANKLIEEFMLLANKKVAEFIGKQDPKKTFVYRVHDEPDESKLAALQNVVGRFGYKLNLQDRKSVSNSLNNLLKEVNGKKEQNLVDTLTIRTMSKAEYTTRNIGHYGLAFDYYTHFTSPIRRYPDVMVHRLLQHYLEGGKSANEDIYEDKCNHSSNMEGLATRAERDSIKYMQIRFMEDHKNEEFVGVISGVTDWGIYIEIIANKCEGMVSVRDMKDDHYQFDEDHYAVIGKKNNIMYQLGEEVVVKVKSTDLVKKHLDFTLIGKHEA
ncbi:RNB domain-containing ribonuclease [Subsaximicrobium wynnwilliamsii]|uniref:Ribonuclease R n=1 Tax=Subsaximicrobium wynnwilliamsii TaxID=291179 RepID=A0A5C6ZHI9_9FLAO|nr:RNB domain-containing ribonuclease [Subsaximicrobium wynnwilliamsii]TXD82639.1 RNB domain-containing ribonuclease [Subsaximicrobium wynnwilliamsii]TXD88374.1 RNB domain-containing ribonuclease [Subsaximicrobium wynnwilliamsii]TXE02301.1 RNB domain-containing ribonuclease [Subsaximicrobium wynnwilliamsii]